MPQPPVPHAPGSPMGADPAPALSAEHYAQLAAAHRAYAPIRRALRVAMFSASTLGLFAALSLPFAFFSLKGAFVGLGLAAATYFEFQGRAAMGRLEINGPKTLMWNQVSLTGVIVIYCLWCMADAWFGPDVYAEAVASSPELGEMLAPYSDLFRELTVGIYAVVLFLGLIVQALVIRYYHTRKAIVEKYLAETPAWILAWNRP